MGTRIPLRSLAQRHGDAPAGDALARQLDDFAAARGLAQRPEKPGAEQRDESTGENHSDEDEGEFAGHAVKLCMAGASAIQRAT